MQQLATGAGPVEVWRQVAALQQAVAAAGSGGPAIEPASSSAEKENQPVKTADTNGHVQVGAARMETATWLGRGLIGYQSSIDERHGRKRMCKCMMDCAGSLWQLSLVTIGTAGVGERQCTSTAIDQQW